MIFNDFLLELSNHPSDDITFDYLHAPTRYGASLVGRKCCIAIEARFTDRPVLQTEVFLTPINFCRLAAVADLNDIRTPLFKQIAVAVAESTITEIQDCLAQYLISNLKRDNGSRNWMLENGIDTYKYLIDENLSDKDLYAVDLIESIAFCETD